MTSQARLAFIGLGTMGRDLLRETVKNPKAQIAALCDLDRDALDKAVEVCGFNPARYSDYLEMLRQENLDGAIVAVPQNLHAEISIATLNAGLHTFCEKPLGLSVKECEVMVGVAKQNGKGLMTGQVLRYIGVYRFMLEQALSGEFGKPFAVRIIRSMGRWDTWARPWRYKAATSGGMLLEVNAHEIDFMRCLLGEAVRVNAAGSRFINDEVDYDDFIAATVWFKNGGIGSLTSACSDHLGRYGGEILLERGTFYYDSITQQVHLIKSGGEKQVIPYAEVHPEWESGVYRELREFVESCLGEHPMTIPGEEGLRNVEIAEACYLSIREGRTVTLPLSGTP